LLFVSNSLVDEAANDWKETFRHSPGLVGYADFQDRRDEEGGTKKDERDYRRRSNRKTNVYCIVRGRIPVYWAKERIRSTLYERIALS